MKPFSHLHIFTSSHLYIFTSLFLFVFLNHGLIGQSSSETPMSCGLDPNTQTPPSQSHRSNAFCADPSLVKYVRLAYHFILTDNDSDFWTNSPLDPNIPATTISKPGNFTPNHDGLGNFDYNGYDRAHEITDIMNSYLANNNDHRRKADGITYPANPPNPNLQYVVSAVLFHENSQDWNQGSWFTTNKYNYGSNDVIDIYMFPYWGNGTSGIVIGGLDAPNKYNSIDSYMIYANPAFRDFSKIYLAGVIMHELGHNLSLNHTWNRNDNCDDTPRGELFDDANNSGVCFTNEADCGRYDPSLCPCTEPGSIKPCDEWYKISNNWMDSGENYPAKAFTTCQIDRIQSNLNTYDGYIHSCNGCAPATCYFEVENTCIYTYPDRTGQYVTSGVQINASASYNVDEWFIEVCELNSSGNCTSNSYTSPWQVDAPKRLILSNYFTFQPNKDYRVKLTANQSTCPLNESFQVDISTVSCSTTIDPDIDIIGDATVFSESLGITYKLNIGGELDLYAVNTTSGHSFDLLLNETHSVGDFYSHNFNTNGIPEGIYQVVGIFTAAGFENQVSVDSKVFIKS